MQQTNPISIRIFKLLLIISMFTKSSHIFTCLSLFEEPKHIINARKNQLMLKFKEALTTGNIEKMTSDQIVWVMNKRGFESLLVEIASQNVSTAMRLLKLLTLRRQSHSPRDQQLSYRNHEGLNPIHLIIKNEISCKIDFLIHQGRQAISQRYHSPQREAFIYKQFLCTIFEAQDCNGNTPLHYALLKKEIDIELIKEIIAYHSNACCISNKYGNTPVHLAAIKPEILNLFLKIGYYSTDF